MPVFIGKVVMAVEINNRCHGYLWQGVGLVVVGAVGSVVPGLADVELDGKGLNSLNVVVAAFVPTHDDGGIWRKLREGFDQFFGSHG